jgi:YbbR domain-containing protein
MRGLDRASLAAVWQRLQPLRDRRRWRAAFTQDLGLKVVSLGVAFGLWVFVNASERDTEQGLQVPLEMRDLPAALMITSPRVDFVDVRVSGPRTLLSRIDRRRLSIPLDLAGVHAGPAVFRIATDSLNLPRGVKIVRITPAQITLDLERIGRRSAPVRVQTTGKLPAGLRLLETHASPDEVQVIGPMSAVEEIQLVETEPLDLSSANSGIVERELGLVGVSELISYSAQRVGVQVHVGEVETDREFSRVPIGIRHSAHRAAIEPPALRVFVRGPKRTVESLELGEAEVYIDAADLAPGRYVRTPVIALPAGVEVLRHEPETVRIRLSKGQR